MLADSFRIKTGCWTRLLAEIEVPVKMKAIVLEKSSPNTTIALIINLLAALDCPSLILDERKVCALRMYARATFTEISVARCLFSEMRKC